MSEFEYHISFYGLLLGLSVAGIASKFLNAIGAVGALIGDLAVVAVLLLVTGFNNFSGPWQQ